MITILMSKLGLRCSVLREKHLTLSFFTGNPTLVWKTSIVSVTQWYIHGRKNQIKNKPPSSTKCMTPIQGFFYKCGEIKLRSNLLKNSTIVEANNQQFGNLNIFGNKKSHSV